MESNKIFAFWHKTQFGNIIIKFEKGPILGYINRLDDGKYQFIVTPEFKFNKTLFSHILAKFGIILTESVNLKDTFNKYLYKCVTTNDIPTNINNILSSLNKNGAILTNFVDCLKPYNLSIGTLLQKQNGFKINSDGIYNYCMQNELFTNDDKPNILHFWRLIFESFDPSNFEKVNIEVQEPKVEVKVQEPKVDVKVQEPKVEVKVQEPKVEVEVEESKVEVEVEVEESKVEVEVEEPITKTQLSNDECNLIIFISETTGNSWASHVLGISIQYVNKTQQLIDAINLVQKILVSYNHKDFNLTRLAFNQYY